MIKKLPQKVKNLKGTKKIAAGFLKQILRDSNKVGQVVGLSGDLGVGKTAFTKEIAKLLGIKSRVTSPTFVIMKKYPIKKGEFKFLFHLDAYRLKNPKELLHLGWDEIVTKKEHLIFIEWPENVADAMPKGSRNVFIQSDKLGVRTFLIS